MRKRAKCKVCNSILEVTLYDMTFCKCGEVSIDMLSGEFHANVQDDIDNLILIDDEGNEIIPIHSEEIQNFSSEHVTLKLEENLVSLPSYKEWILKRNELIETLDAMAKNIESLPSNARQSPITHSDFGALITLLSSIFRAS